MIIVVKVGGQMSNVPIGGPARFHFQNKALIGVSAGDFLDINIEERILRAKPIGHRLDRRAFEGAKRTQASLFFGFSQYLVTAGFEDITSGFGFLLGFEQRRSGRSGAISADHSCQPLERAD